ncbi:MAG: monoamine oxidase [Myxococcota bacterium]|jgi:monoamine oxidase
MLPELLPEFTTDSDGNRTYSERTKTLFEIIEHGLPAAGTPRSVAVSGAGFSGMVAASLLRQQGYEVTIYEANTRVGGRIKTLRHPLSEGLSGEAGAMRLVSSYQLVYKYISMLGLNTFTFINHDVIGNELIFVNGVKCTRDQYEADPDMLKFPTIGRERGHTAQDLWAGNVDTGFEGALHPIQKRIDPQWGGKATLKRWEKVIEDYGQFSVRGYLKEKAKYSEGAVAMIEVMLNLESRSNLSLIQQIIETLDHDPTGTYEGIVGGMDRLPLAFAEMLSAHDVPIYFNQMLTAIDRTGERIRLRFQAGDAQALNRPRGVGVPAPPRFPEAEADAVVLTIPFPMMRYLDVQPPFSQQKRKAIRELNYNAATKIFLEFDHRFWEQGPKPIYGGQTITDLAARFIYYPSTDLRSAGGGVVISIYVWATEARGWDSLTERQRVEFSLNDLARIHGEQIREHFVVGTAQSWLIDDFSMGEAAMLEPGQIQELEGTIPVPEGEVYFAGDATSFKIAWIEGAIEAGIRAAAQVAGLSIPGVTP